MSHPVLIAGGAQGSTGRLIALLLLQQNIPVRAFVHQLDARSDELRHHGAEIFAGDLLNPGSVHHAMENVRRAYFTYPVADGLLEAATIFAATARAAGLELLVNNSQSQDMPDSPEFRDLRYAPSFRNLQHRLADRIFDWAQIRVAHLQAPPYYENVRALVRRSVAQQDTVFLPWGEGDAIIPLAGAEDVAQVAATLLAAPDLPAERVFPLITAVPTVRDIVATLARALGRPIRYVPITDDQWALAVKDQINPHALDHLSHLWQFFRTSGRRFPTTDAVRSVTGRTPQTLEDFFRAHASSFGPQAPDPSSR